MTKKKNKDTSVSASNIVEISSHKTCQNAGDSDGKDDEDDSNVQKVTSRSSCEDNEVQDMSNIFGKLAITSRETRSSLKTPVHDRKAISGTCSSRSTAAPSSLSSLSTPSKSIKDTDSHSSSRAGSRQRKTTQQSPVLSRYGVDLSDLRDYVDLPPDDILAHGLHLSGFPSYLSAEEKISLTSPWSDVGANISWLPDNNGAVAMFCSIATANRASTRVKGDPAIRVQSLRSCPPHLSKQALEAGLIVPPRAKADVTASSRLIMNSLGLKLGQYSNAAAAERRPGVRTRSQTRREMNDVAKEG